jgi:hypothetical protein
MSLPGKHDVEARQSRGQHAGGDKILVDHPGLLVMVGHSLGESDAHLVDAMAASPTDLFAISIRLHPEKDPQLTVNRYHALLPEKELLSFDSATHPLGSPELHLPDNAAGVETKESRH